VDGRKVGEVFLDPADSQTAEWRLAAKQAAVVGLVTR
jgi:hypothetical protein